MTGAFEERTQAEWDAIEKENKAREKREQEAQRNYLLNKLRPPAFAQTDPKKLPVHAKKVKKVLSWNPKSERGLLLHGETGVGKTRTVWLLLTRLINEGWKPLYYPADRLAQELAGSYSRKGGHTELMSRLMYRRVVVIDDLGKAKPTQRVEEDLFSIVRERTDNLLPLIVTTNFVGEGLLDRYLDPETAKPMLRRLREFCECIHFNESVS